MTYDNPENPTLYETFKPKIEKYNEALKAGILEEYKIPDDVIPTSYGVDVTKIPEKFLTKSEILITELKGVDLAAKIAKGEYTSVEVFTAYAKRATMAHQLTNCAMELFMDEGLKRAKELDEIFKSTGKTIGPLHGLPISLKEHYDYKGKITHAGYVGLIDNISTETNQCVQILYDAGAVFYIRTTEPQLLMHLCSNNNITGIARNPNNTGLTTGGSSSGEGAIAAMKGSVFGVGSDIGGSIRAPAGFCGVWGLRPTQKRIPLLPLVPSGRKVQENVVPVLGPLARSAEDLELFMKVEINSQPWKNDATLIPLPWREVPIPTPKQLKVAIVYDDGVVKPTAPILRGLEFAAKKLKEAGVKVVEWESFNVAETVKAAYNGYNADGNAGQLSLLKLSGEPILKLSHYILEEGSGYKGQTAAEYQGDTGIRDLNRTAYLKKMEELDVDFILCPVYASVAPLPETVHYWGYTNLWNILDFPNVIFPTGLKCDPLLDKPDSTYVPRNDYEKYEHALYDEDVTKFVGAPINLQLTGKRWFDEELVKASKVVAEIIEN
ncbi:hypothetical protein C6P42_005336 [Pichia californica]|nr:hypothetical protein C6P42_005336 [[Candida] californica]